LYAAKGAPYSRCALFVYGKKGNLMRRILSLLVGFGLGGLIGAALVRLLPESHTLRARLQQGWNESLVAAQSASAQRRAELEAELAAKMKLPGG
jgi:hypothetical protein